MRENPGLKTGREGRRLETQKHQREATTHFHPRGLARKIVHAHIKAADVYGSNQVQPGASQSPFARNWRTEADTFARR